MLRYRLELEARRLAPATINLRLAAVRRLAFEAADTGLPEPRTRRRHRSREGPKRIGVRLGNWLTADQGRNLLGAPDVQKLKGRRDRAILALMLGCGLRRGEVAGLKIDHLQQREEHWVIADLIGKAAHIRTVPVPDWVQAAVDVWLTSAGITQGRMFRCVSRKGSVWGEGITEKVIWHRGEGKRRPGWYCQTVAARLSPHLCPIVPRGRRRTGGSVSIGHVSVETTERYLGCKQRLRSAVNDRIGLEP